MTKMRKKKALQRYQAVSAVMLRVARGKSLRAACGEIAKMEFYDADLKGTVRYSASSLWRWVKAFESRGIEALEVHGRNRPPQALSSEVLEACRSEKLQDPQASVPEVIRRIKLRQDGLDNVSISRTTVWRSLSRMGLPTGRLLQDKVVGDVRSFEFAHRMQCLLCDGKHFVVGPNRVKRVAFIWIDDASRRVLDLAVGTAESTELFVRSLSLALRRAGLADRVFLDRGPGFASNDSALVCARLQMNLILGTAGYPEGRGKIERFNQTLEKDVLRNWARSPDIPTDRASLELRLRHYCLKVYNKRPHESLGDLSPDERWLRDSKPLRAITDEALHAACLLSHGRRVSVHHLVKVRGRTLEMPMGTAGRHVLLEEDLLSGFVYFEHEGKRIRLHEPDRHANAHARRTGKASSSQRVSEKPLPPSAADLSFLKDHKPITDADGGFQDDD